MIGAETALFESWRGQYSDSPRAISETLARTHPELHRIWVSDETSSLPSDVTSLRRHSPAYFYRLLACDYLFTNDLVTKHLIKGPKVTYVQAWHGTPLKLIGLDERHQSYSGAKPHLKRLLRDVAKWDYLISPSRTCTELFRSAFGYEGAVLETGYPRNDILSLDRGQIRQRVRRSLGIDDNTMVVLYAPTWRDDSTVEFGRFRQPELLNLDVLFRGLGRHTILLNRLHKNALNHEDYARSSVIDVSHHSDIAELYLAADILVSDYSSAIYDFAVTRKPIVLFAPDLDAYRDHVRGMYFDYEDWAPGPITFTTAELADVLNKVDMNSTPCKYVSFIAKFCPYEDGRAAERVIDAVFGKREV